MLLQFALGIALILFVVVMLDQGRGRRHRGRLRRSVPRPEHGKAEAAGEAAILADPNVQRAIDEGRIYDASRHVSRASGLPPRLALELVEQHAHH